MCIIVGIIIGVGILRDAHRGGSGRGERTCYLADIPAGTDWALCCAELATAYPHEGGDYVYQNRAYGGWAGYLFGWSQLAIIRPGDIALMAFVFARYAQTLYAPFENARQIYAAAAVVVLTIINVLGVKQGKWTQNILTVIKALGLLTIFATGIFGAGQPLTSAEPAALTTGGLKLALILVLFTYGGWYEMAYVAGVVKRPQRTSSVP
jgi:amino acid transporter